MPTSAGEATSSLLGGMSRESLTDDLVHDQQAAAVDADNTSTFTRFKELARTNSEEQRANARSAKSGPNRSSVPRAAPRPTGSRARGPPPPQNSQNLSPGRGGRPRPPLKSRQNAKQAGVPFRSAGQSIASQSRSESRSKSRASGSGSGGASGSGSGGASAKSTATSSKSIKQRRLEALNHQAELDEQEQGHYHRRPGNLDPTINGARRPSRTVSDAGASYPHHASDANFRSVPAKRTACSDPTTADAPPTSATHSFMKNAIYRQNPKPIDAGVDSIKHRGRSSPERPGMVRRSSRMKERQGAEIGDDSDSRSVPSPQTSGCPPIPIISSIGKPGAKEQLRHAQGANDDLSEENSRLRSEISLIEERVSKMENIFATSAANYSDKMRQMERLYRSKLSSLEAKYRDLISTNEVLGNDVRDLEHDNMDLQRQLNEETRQVETLQMQLDERKELSTVLEQELNEVWEENEGNKKLIDDLQEERDQANLKANNLAHDLEEHTHEKIHDSMKQEESIRALEIELEKTLQSGMERIRKLESELTEERAEMSMLKPRSESGAGDSDPHKDKIDNSPPNNNTTDTNKQDVRVHFDNMPPRQPSSPSKSPTIRRVSQRSNITADTDAMGNLSEKRGNTNRPSRVFSFASSGELSSTILEKEVTDLCTSPISADAVGVENDGATRTARADKPPRDIVKALQHFESVINSPNEGDNEPNPYSAAADDLSTDGDKDDMMPIGEVSSEQDGKRKSWVSEDTEEYSEDDLNEAMYKHVADILEPRSRGILGSLDSDKALVKNDDRENEVSSTNTTEASIGHSVDLLKLQGSSNTLVSGLGDSLRSGLDIGARNRVTKHFGW